VRAVQEIAGELRPGGEQHLFRDAGQLAVLLICCAPFGQVQSAADEQPHLRGHPPDLRQHAHELLLPYLTDVFWGPGRARHEESLVAVAYRWCHLVR
jgi:hypothetical protein